MNQQYQSLYQLLAQDVGAQNYFLDLPDYVRDQIEQHPENLSSMQSLKSYVNDLVATTQYNAQ